MIKPFITPIANDQPNWRRLNIFGDSGAYTVNFENLKENKVFAVCDGVLSVIPFDLFNLGSELKEEDLLTEASPSQKVGVYLNIHPTLFFDDRFVAANPLGVTKFYYGNLDAVSIKSALETEIRKAVLNPEVSGENIFQGFLNGAIHIPVTSGQQIGEASVVENYVSTAPERPILKFAAFNEDGVIDPAEVFLHFTSLVLDKDGQVAPPAMSDLLSENFLSSTYLSLEKEALLDIAAQGILPFAVLNKLRKDCDLNYREWRRIGDLQKGIYLEQLKSRAGVPMTPELPAAHFQFNAFDWKNVFQLEAIVEFYANFTEPMTDSHYPDKGDSSYIPINFLTISGNDASVEGDIVTIHDDDIRFEDLLLRDPKTGTHDIPDNLGGLIELAADTNRIKKHYRLKGLTSQENRQVTIAIDGAEDRPAYPDGVAYSSWKVRSRPILVLIDPITARIKGGNARIISIPMDNLTVLELDIPFADLRINKDFDTIYLDHDRSRQSKRYRIVRGAYGPSPLLNLANFYDHSPGSFEDNPSTDGSIVGLEDGTSRILIEGVPDFGEHTGTPWSIPAGLGGNRPMKVELKGIQGTEKHELGYDGYEGWMFMVYDGEIKQGEKWTSMTSRLHPLEEIKTIKGKPRTPEHNSSVRGNSLYYYSSFLSENRFINYAFQVVDRLSLIIDKCEEAKRYFFNRVVWDGKTEENSEEESVTGNEAGKTAIRIHNGNNSSNYTGSAGCQVSPRYFALRYALIQHYQDERELLGLQKDNTLESISVKKRMTGYNVLYNKQKYGNLNEYIPFGQWNNKLTGQYWLIRPEERSVGTTAEEINR